MNSDNSQTLGSLFAEQAGQNGSLPAVSCEETVLSYADLAKRTQELASVLRGFGVDRDVPVAVCMPRSVDLIVAVLGVLRAGGAYVPLDPLYPSDRLEFILADCGAQVLLTVQGVTELSAAHTVFMDQPPPADQKEWTLPSAEDLAYIIYTSGSTGKPKGVLCHHCGAVNMLADGQRRKSLGPGDRCSWWTSLCFDVSVYEIFSALTCGAELVVVPEEVRAEGSRFCDWLSDQRITSAYIPPMLTGNFSKKTSCETGRIRMRRLLTGVEPIPERHLIDLARAVPELCVINGYGPTEAAVYCTAYQVDPKSREQSRITPIGKPLDGVEIRLLDDAGNAVPDGQEGEIYIGGVQVERGYLNCRQLTRSSFIDGWYRTGDRAVRLPDGNLMFRGRTDYQIKFLGFRIEPGEIESALCRIDGLREAVVILREDLPGMPRLAGYYTVDEGTPPGADEIRRILAAELPAYMVPSLLIRIPALPLTLNGKINRSALPEPSKHDLAQLRSQEFKAPVSENECRVAKLFCSVLKLDQAGLNDDFFALGGHSLMAAQVISRLGSGVTLRDFYENPTVGELARLLSETEVREEIPPAGKQTVYPVTPSQRTMWMMHHTDRSGTLSNIPEVVHLSGPLNISAMQRALNEVIRRHDALRMVFSVENGEVVQHPLDNVHLDISVTDLSGLDVAERDRRAAEIRHESGAHRFDLSVAPLMRADLVKLAENRHDFYLNIHHIAIDGWGLTVLNMEFAAIYEAFAEGKPSPLPPPERAYRDVAVWLSHHLQSRELTDQLAYWKEKLAAPRPDLHFQLDFQRPEQPAHKAARHAFVLLPELTSGLTNLGRRENASLFMVLAAIWQMLLHRATGSSDVITGTAIAGRNHPQLEQVIGTFINALALRTDFNGVTSFRGLLARVRRTALEAYAHQDVPFVRIMEAVDDGSRHPLFRNSLILHNMPQPPKRFAGLTMTDDEVGNDTAKMDMLLYFIERSGQLEGQLEYDTELFAAESVEHLVNDFITLAQQVVADFSRPLDEYLADNETSALSCYVIGEGSLCLRCIDVLRRNGLRVFGLISPDAANRRWAHEKGVSWYHPDEGFEKILSVQPFDFLFSIVNSRIIPADILKLPRRAAVNYHDAPLPRYAGMYATAWALMNRERSHGVTWHQMVEQVDAGDILKQKQVSVQENDTSFTLNARCYDTAVQALSELAAELVEGRETFTVQDLSKRTYNPLHRRPSNGCLIDWSAPQEEIDALRRALDFGGQPNELGLPKVLLGGSVYVLQSNGELIDLEGNGYSLRYPAIGEPCDWIVNEPEFPEFGKTVEKLNAEVAFYESFWVREYKKFQGLEIPDAMRGTGQKFQLDNPASFLCFLARFFGKEFFGVGWDSRTEIPQFFETVVPLNIQVHLDQPFGDALEAAEKAIERCCRCRTVARDVHLRIPSAGQTPVYSVVLSDDHAICSSALWNRFQIFRRNIRHDEPLYVQPVLSEHDRQELEKFGRRMPGFGETCCIHQLFERQAARTPNAVAVESGSGSLTYAELDRRAAVLAVHLQAHNIDPDTPVGLFVDRSLEMCIGILGILKAGGAYVPLDPDYPRDRLEFIIGDTSMPMIVSVSKLSAQVAGLGCRVFCMDRLKSDLDIYPVPPATNGNLAYILYTSGSTGKPKGVMVEHCNVVNHCLASIQTYGITSKDRVLQFFSMNFDGSVEELFPAWACGATVVLRSEELSSSVREFGQFVEQHRISVVDLPTAYWHEWVRRLHRLPSSLRAVIIGGEKVSAELCRVWLQKTGDRIRLFNTYGPTECTVVATVQEVRGKVYGEVPIGVPIAGMEVYVADARMQRVPVGMSGELLLGGEGVARGYLNRSDRTAEKFISNPWGEGRLYRTGDLAYFRKDGRISFAGRIDNQVKIRGFRIEPDEIAAVLERHSDITQAVVIVRTDLAEHKELAVYYIVEPGSSPSVQDLRAFLAENLPEYMVPSAFMELDEFPVAPGGKVDRRALPSPMKVRLRERENYVIPSTALQKILAEIWTVVLGIDEIGIHDNFFDLGGHSLLAIQLVERVLSSGSELSVAELFQYPTIAQMAELIEGRSAVPAGGETECLVLLKKGEEGRVPFFLLHSAPGDLLGYSNLVHNLPAEQPVYGFQSVGLIHPEKMHSTMLEMASYYVSILNEFLPEGPVLLGGWCYGGYVALEMARQLKEQGRDVRLLALIDAWAYLPKERKAAFYWRRLQLMRIIGLREWSRVMRRKIYNMICDDTGDAEKVLDGVTSREGMLANREEVYRHNREAARKYRPCYYPGTVTLFRSDEIAAWFLPDMTMEWGALTEDQDIHLVPGGHRDMLHEPAVQTLASRLFECIETALT